jgi:hypothetical protein
MPKLPMGFLEKTFTTIAVGYVGLFGSLFVYYPIKDLSLFNKKAILSVEESKRK